ncbi:F-box domain containing protein [Coccidioides posadasii C735 delta SOWgp]|uniref:F-box domain-containing protein n=2 Tax=Coccidioides posadasii TaxID=199306 RepID=A0A0J6F0X7_COCPO|nr:F-box domain containing protein [Coccidioides posadasii C735 delta SOWgp]EER28894.1 F-box domain containing protein [Coccidioides posadasii C735 delta SOWgp]KMM63713.1 hypothetical protein CPAG_00067 [Coccidioides posadasii RMSCC 3488]|eukprot:XP_003071039.1 F-box domain containing protein [Coccidioides posadasii C735 delta SOWgp]
MYPCIRPPPPVPSLPTLPPELLLHIFPYLPPESKLALSLTARRFYQILSDQVPKWPQLAPNEQYSFLYLLERLGFSIPSNPKTPVACCSGCKTTHSSYKFLLAELNKGTDDRTCRDATRSLWVSPDTQYSFNDLKDRSADRGWLTDDGTLRRRGGTDLAIYTTYKILSLPKSTQAPRKKIASILNTFNLPSCPHMRLNHPVIIEGYKPDAHPIDVKYYLSDMRNDSAKCQFPGCKTSIYWIARTHVNKRDWKTFYIEVSRDVGNLNRPNSPAWLAQLITPNADKLTKFWNDRLEWKRQMLAYEERRYEHQLQRQQRQQQQNESPSSIATAVTPTLANLPALLSPGSSSDHTPNIEEDQYDEIPPPLPDPVPDEADLFKPILGDGFVAAEVKFQRKFKRINGGTDRTDTWYQHMANLRSTLARWRFSTHPVD